MAKTAATKMRLILWYAYSGIIAVLLIHIIATFNSIIILTNQNCLNRNTNINSTIISMAYPTALLELWGIDGVKVIVKAKKNTAKANKTAYYSFTKFIKNVDTPPLKKITFIDLAHERKIEIARYFEQWLYYLIKTNDKLTNQTLHTYASHLARTLNKFYVESYVFCVRNKLPVSIYTRKILWTKDVEFEIVRHSINQLMEQQAVCGRYKGVVRETFSDLNQELIDDMLTKMNKLKETIVIIQRKCYLIIAWRFGVRGGKETYALHKLNFVLKNASSKSPQYYQFNPCAVSKTFTGGLSNFRNKRSDIKLFDNQIGEHNYFAYFHEYYRRLPSDCFFWLYADKNTDMLNAKRRIGVNPCSKFMQSCNDIINGNLKVCNHLGRAAKITACLNGNMNQVDVMRETGHRNILSLKSYDRPDLQRELNNQNKQFGGDIIDTKKRKRKSKRKRKNKNKYNVVYKGPIEIHYHMDPMMKNNLFNPCGALPDLSSGVPGLPALQLPLNTLDIPPPIELLPNQLLSVNTLDIPPPIELPNQLPELPIGLSVNKHSNSVNIDDSLSPPPKKKSKKKRNKSKKAKKKKSNTTAGNNK